MGKIIHFYKNTILDFNINSEAELLLSVIDNELKRIRFLLSTSKVINSNSKSAYFSNAKTIFKNLKKAIIRADDTTDTLNNLDCQQIEYLLSAYQLLIDKLENNNIEISLDIQDIYLKLITIYIEKIRTMDKSYMLNYHMYLSNSPLRAML